MAPLLQLYDKHYNCGTMLFKVSDVIIQQLPLLESVNHQYLYVMQSSKAKIPKIGNDKVCDFPLT